MVIRDIHIAQMVVNAESHLLCGHGLPHQWFEYCDDLLAHSHPITQNVHRIQHNPETSAFPEPAAKFNARGVTKQDWSCFVNQLLPAFQIDQSDPLN